MSRGMSVDADWEAKWDLDTLMEAAEIKKDAKRLSAAEAKVKEEQTALKKVETQLFGPDHRNPEEFQEVTR